MIETREWMFRVACHTNPGEHVYVVGNCEALGCWKPAQVIPLFLETNKDGGSSEEGIWSRTINIPLNKIDYRYCVCVTVENDAEETQPKVYAIKSWETNLQPRQIPENDSNVQDPSVEKFGCYGGYERVDQGWLVKDSVVHIKLCSSNLYNNPIMLWKKKYIGKKYRVKVIPIDISKTNSYEPLMNGGLEESTEFDISDVRHQAKSSWPIMEAAVMKEGLCHFQYQEQFGIPYNEEDFLVFQCRMIHPDSIAYLVDIYVEEDGKEIPKYIGCSFILPSNLRENFGVTTLPITSQKHLPIGQLTAHYMVVNPMNPCICDMSISYARHWKDSWKGLEVGHRGAGNSYHSQPTSCANIRENTVASLKYAAENGADMVEFDVQLSKDHIPVIYHDFHACIALKRKKEQEQTDLLEIPIKDLTLEQLQALKDLSHLQEGQPCDILSYCDQEDMVYHKKEKGLNRFRDEEFEDHQPFPTLQRALETVPVSCGFNVEVKWTMQMKDGTYELQHPFELNYFLDLILKVVLEHSGKRKIVFSCFHPDICTMLRLKQNRYPVLFLTQGVSENWPPYEDQRTSSIKHAVLYATCADILGINVNTEDLLRDPSQMKLALEHNMIVFCWGDENNDVDNIKFLKGIGMHGIIYDKIDVYNTKEKKESVFLCEEREALEAMRKVASSSRENDGNSEDDNKYKAGTNSSFGSMFASEESSVNEGVCNLRQFGMIVQ